MDRFYNNNSKIIGTNSNTSSSYDPSRDSQSMLGRSPNPYMNPIFDSQLLDPYVTDPMIRNWSATAAGFVPTSRDIYQYPAIDSGRFNSQVYQNYPHQYRHSNLSSRGSSPSRLSAIGKLKTPPSRSPPVFAAPVKVDEGNVVVMDGILVSSHGGLSKPVSVSDFSTESSSGRSKYIYKTDTCRYWDDLKYCRLGSVCQYAHGKDELRPIPIRYSQKNKIESSAICRSFKAGTCQHGNKCRFIHNKVMMEEWSPLDDGIEVPIPGQKCPTRTAVNAQIHSILYPPLRRRPRLPVFTKICPDQ